MALARLAGALLGTTLVFVASAVGGALLHVGTPRARRIVAAEVNAALAPLFKGSIHLERVGALGLWGASERGRPRRRRRGAARDRRARVYAPRLSAWTALESLVARHAPLHIRLSEIAVDDLEVRLDSDPDGTLPLAEAFAPRTVAPPPPPGTPEGPGLLLELRRITLRHAHAQGAMAGAPPLDVDVDDLAAEMTLSPEALEGDVARARVLARALAGGADVAGALQAHVLVPSAPGQRPRGRAAWDGKVGEVAETVEASLTADRADAKVDVPAATPEAVRTLWPASPLTVPAQLHVEAHGPLDDLTLAVHAGVGPAALDVKGTAAVEGARHAALTVDARDVDARQLAPGAPATKLGLTGAVKAGVDAAGAITGEATLRFAGGQVAGQDVPPASIEAHASRSAAAELRADVDLVVDAPGAPTHVTARINPARVVAFTVDAHAPDLARVRELHGAVGGSVNVTAQGEVDLARETLAAGLRADGAGLALGPTTVERATVTVDARGPLASPRFMARLAGGGVVAGGVHLVTVSASADGTKNDAHIALLARGPDTPDLDASADVGLAGGVAIDHVSAALASRGERALVTADAVRFAGGGVRVEGGRVTGLGDPATVAASFGGGSLKVLAHTEGLDLARVARLARLEKRVEAGKASFDVDMNLSRGAASGTASVALDRATVQGVKDLSARVDASIDGRKVAGKVHAEAAGVAAIDVSAPSLVIGGAGALSPSSWRRAWGSVTVDANADLARVAALLPAGWLPLSSATGKVSLTGHVERDGLSDTTPDVSLHLNTSGLGAAAAAGQHKGAAGAVVADPPHWVLSGIDLQADLGWNGDTGELAVSTVVHDAKGPIVDVELTSPHAICQDLFDDTARCLGAAETTTFDAEVTVPERELASLPRILRQGYLTGQLKAKVSAKGTLHAPTVDVAASLSRAQSQQWERRPMNVDVVAHYDGSKATASVRADSRSRGLLDASATVDGVPAERLLAGDRDLPWVASAHAHLDGFPLQSVPSLDDRLVSGLVTGDLGVDDLHRDARAQADLSVASLVVGSLAYKGARAHFTADGKIVDASVRLDQTDGFAEATGHASASWGAAMAPALDASQPVQASLVSKALRLAVLQPFVAGVLDEIDGRLDANAKVQLDPKTQGAKLSGEVTLKGGALEAVAGGGEFHDVAGHLTLSPDGAVVLDRLSGSGLTGHFTAAGSARLSGTKLQAAKAILEIPKGGAIPVTADGKEIGTLSGRVELTAAQGAGGALALGINVPSLHVALPEGDTTSAQALGPMAKVTIGAHRGTGETFVVIPLDPPEDDDAKPATGGGGTKVAVTLGDVQVVKGTQLKVDLTGKLGVEATGATRVDGQIQLKRGGLLAVQGKRFTVESGTVTFVGDDPSNPEVVVKAAWTGPDGTVVFANFVGPLKTGKVTLQSEPPLSRQEIVQLLLFGSPDGQQAQSPSAGTENSAIATAGGEAAAPLNHALNQLGLGAVTARIDTSQTNPKPEVEVQIANDLSLEIGVVLGVPPPGVNPDRTLVTLDWRFMSKWSLASTVGDAGTTVFDVLWKKRY